MAATGVITTRRGNSLSRQARRPDPWRRGRTLRRARLRLSGARTPKLWNVPKIAAAQGVPVASLLVENPHATCVADVWLSADTIRDVRKGGRVAALEAAERIARQLEPLIWQPATGRLPRKQDTPTRSRPRRTRAEVLAGIQAATEARTRARLVHLESELREIAAERIDEPQA